MRAPGWLIVLVFIGSTKVAFPQARDAGRENESKNLEIGISFNSADSVPRRIGNIVAGKVLISYRNAPSGSSVYLMVHPLKGDALLTPEGLTIRLTGLNINLVANFQSESDGGVFRIDRANYPEELLIPAPELKKFAGELLDEEPAKAVSTAFGPQGLRLVLGFLASLGRGGSGQEQAFFSFTLPRLEHSYDGILITPVLMSYEPDGQQKIVFRSDQMHSLKIMVTSD